MSHNFANTLSFESSQPNGYKVLFTVVEFACIFSVIVNVTICSYTWWSFLYITTLRKMTTQVLCPLLNQILLLSLSCRCVVCILIPDHIQNLKIFPFCRLHVHCCVPHNAVSKLVIISSAYFFVACIFGVIFNKSLLTPKSWHFFHMVSSTNFIYTFCVWSSIHCKLIFTNGIKVLITSVHMLVYDIGKGPLALSHKYVDEAHRSRKSGLQKGNTSTLIIVFFLLKMFPSA